RHVLSEQADPSCRGPEEAGDEIEERRLAGAVGTDDGQPLAGRDGEAHAAERGETAEVVGKGLDLERGQAPDLSRRCRTRPTRPAGANRVTGTEMTPRTSTQRPM